MLLISVSHGIKIIKHGGTGMLVLQIIEISKKDPIISADPLPNITIPSDDEIVSELNKTYHLKNDQINFFRKNGFIKLKKVFSPGVVLKLRAELIKLLKKNLMLILTKKHMTGFLVLK